MEIEGEKFSKKCWDFNDLNKSLESFKKWNKDTLSKIEGITDSLTEVTIDCLWRLCFGVEKFDTTPKIFVRGTFDYLEQALIRAYEATIMHSKLQSIFGETDADKDDPSALQPLAKEVPEDEMLTACCSLLDEVYNKVRPIPNLHENNAFHQSILEYNFAAVKIYRDLPMRTSNDCKLAESAVVDVYSMLKLLEGQRRIKDNILALYKKGLQLKKSFIESDLYKHPHVNLKKGESLEVARFFKDIYECLSKS